MAREALALAQKRLSGEPYRSSIAGAAAENHVAANPAERVINHPQIHQNKKKGYEVQTLRISLNSFEEWLPPVWHQSSSGSAAPAPQHTTIDEQHLHTCLTMLEAQLQRVGIEMCSLGGCTSSAAISFIPHLLRFSKRFSCSVRFTSDSTTTGSHERCICAPQQACELAAKACKQTATECGDDGNFRFCVSFDAAEGTPFFPASFHRSDSNPSILPSCGLSAGLENGDLLFIAAAGTTDIETACANLTATLRQVLLPLQHILQSVCEELNAVKTSVAAPSKAVTGAGQGYEYTNPYALPSERSMPAAMQSSSNAPTHEAREPSFWTPYNISTNPMDIPTFEKKRVMIKYLGIDASLNPGLTVVDSVGAGIEHMLYFNLPPDIAKNALQEVNYAAHGMFTTLHGFNTRFGQVS